MARVSLAERFWSKVDIRDPDDCWLWTGTVFSASGYGQIKVGSHKDGTRRDVGAHRVAWQLTHGPIADGLFVLHHCDVRLCVNPAHLFLGTHTDNMRDAKAKGRLALTNLPPTGRGSDAPHVTLTELEVREIRRLRASGLLLREIADRFHVGISQIHRVVTRESWSHLD